MRSLLREYRVAHLDLVLLSKLFRSLNLSQLMLSALLPLLIGLGSCLLLFNDFGAFVN